MRRVFPLIIISLIAAGCGSSDSLPGSGSRKTIGIVVVADSSLRIDPIVTSARVSVLGTGENFEVIDRSREKTPVAGKMDYWYKVRLRDGITGWIYGQNIKVFSEGSSSVEKYAKQLRLEEAEKVRKQLKGKWWSVVGEDNFSDQILSLRDDGTYASLVKGGDKPTEGDYTIDTETSTIRFSKGTAFGDQLSYIIRGNFYVLEVATDKKRIRFKKISNDPNFKGELSPEGDNPDSADQQPSKAVKIPAAKKTEKK